MDNRIYSYIHIQLYNLYSKSKFNVDLYWITRIDHLL